jgi:hypothetical protein
MENKSSKKRLLSDLSEKWKLWTGGGFFAFAFGQTIKNIWEGAGFVHAITQDAAWLYSLPDQNWFQFLCLFAAGYFIWSALKEIKEDHDKKSAIADEERKAALTDVRNEFVAEFSKLNGLLDMVSTKHNEAILVAANAIMSPVAELAAIEDDLMRIRKLQSEYGSQKVEHLLGKYDIAKHETFITNVLIFQDGCNVINSECKSKWRGDMFPEIIQPHDVIDLMVNNDHEILKDNASKRAFFSAKFALESSMRLLNETIKNLEARSSVIRAFISNGSLFI